MIRAAAALCLLALLSACKADRVEIALTGADLAAVALGETRIVPFTAVFSQIGTLEEDERAELHAVEAVLMRTLRITRFAIETGETEWQVAVEGTLPLVPEGAPVWSPWRIDLGPNRSGSEALAAYPSALTVAATPGYDGLAAEIAKIRGELVPDPNQPVTFRLTGMGAWDLLALGVRTAEAPVLVLEAEGVEAVSVTFESDLYEALPATLFLRPRP